MANGCGVSLVTTAPTVTFLALVPDVVDVVAEEREGAVTVGGVDGAVPLESRLCGALGGG